MLLDILRIFSDSTCFYFFHLCTLYSFWEPFSQYPSTLHITINIHEFIIRNRKLFKMFIFTYFHLKFPIHLFKKITAWQYETVFTALKILQIISVVSYYSVRWLSEYCLILFEIFNNIWEIPIESKDYNKSLPELLCSANQKIILWFVLNYFKFTILETKQNNT